MSPATILGVAGSLIIFGVLFEMMRRHHLREKYAVLWFTVGVGALTVTVFPALLTWSAEVIGVQVPANLLFFLASMLLLALSLQHSYELGRLEDKTRALAEEVALLRLAQQQDRQSRAPLPESGPPAAAPEDGPDPA